MPVTRREVVELRRTTLHLNAEIVRLREQVKGLEARVVVYLRADDAGPVTCSAGV